MLPAPAEDPGRFLALHTPRDAVLNADVSPASAPGTVHASRICGFEDPPLGGPAEGLLEHAEIGRDRDRDVLSATGEWSPRFV